MKKALNYFVLFSLLIVVFELFIGYSIFQYRNLFSQSQDESPSSTLHRYSSINKVASHIATIYKKNFPYLDVLDNSSGVYPVNLKNKIINSKYIEGDNVFISRNPVTRGYKFHPLLDYTNGHGLHNFDNDYFGYRNSFDYSANINKNEFRILMSGGSECLGFDHNQPITFLLEKKLRKYYSSTKIRVLNFCMNAYTLPYEIQTFIHLGWNLEPHLVISHTGFNDAYSFQLVPDKFAEKGLTYSFFQEKWMNILYSVEVAKFDEKLFARNHSQEKFINSMVKMLTKYNKVVKASGSDFLVGIQPWNVDTEYREKNLKKLQNNFYSAEDNIVSNFLENNPNADRVWADNVFKSLEELKKQAGNFQMNVINFAKNNEKFPFLDIVHTTPKGAEMIADEYFLYIRENYNNQITKTINSEN